MIFLVHMNLAQYLKLVQKPSLRDLKALAKVEKIILKWVSSSEIAEEFTVELFNLFHEAFRSSPHVFVTEIFFKNQLLLRKTYLNDEYILSEFKKALKISNLKRRQIKLVGVYRSLVSDLFDPYLTILIACTELKEGIFQSMKVSNLGYSETNKVQFLAKRLNNDLFFSGYSSIIRNAISHTGTHGVEYFENKILFRSIRRDRSSPKSQSLEFLTEEVIEFIQKLIDFIISTGTAINLMGLDLNDIIVKDMRFAQKFQMLVTPKQLANRRKSNDRAFGKIWNNDRLARIDKLDHFSRLFAVACKKNGMPAESLRFSENFVIISIPHKILKDKENVTLINRALELAEY